MHKAEDARRHARTLREIKIHGAADALDEYADLQEAMEEFERVASTNPDPEVVRVMLRPVEIVRQRADEKQKARKG